MPLVLESSMSLCTLSVSLAKMTQPKALEAAPSAGGREVSHLLTIRMAGAQRLNPIPWIPYMRGRLSFICRAWKIGVRKARNSSNVPH